MTTQEQQLSKPDADRAAAPKEKPAEPKGLAALFGGADASGLSEAMGKMMKLAIDQKSEET